MSLFSNKKIRISIFIALTVFVGIGFVYLYNNDSLFDEWAYDKTDRSILINHLLSYKAVIDKETIGSLEEQGMKNPLNTLRRNLYKNRKLIPWKGVLGGVMDYTGEFIMKSNQRVSVDVSDDHIDGKMLLKYEIENKRIKWTIIKIYSTP